MAIIKVNSTEVTKSQKSKSRSEIDKILEKLKQEQTIIGSNSKEHSDQDIEDREKKRNENSDETQEAEDEVKESTEDLDRAINKAERESDEGEDGDSGGSSGGGTGKGRGGKTGDVSYTGLSLTGQSRMTQLQHHLDDWIKKLLGRPLSKTIYDPSERSRRVPGLWGREVEEVIPKKGEKVLIIVLDLSGSIQQYSTLMKKALFTVAEKLAKGKVVTKVLLKNFDDTDGLDRFLTIPQFKNELRKLIELGTGSDPTPAWLALKRDMRTLGRKIESISGLVIITDFQFFGRDDTVTYTVPKEIGKIPILGLGVGGSGPEDERKFFIHNKGKDVRIVRITEDGKVQRVIHKEDN